MDTDESLVVARDGGHLVAFDASTGEPQWSTSESVTGAWIVGTLVLPCRPSGSMDEWPPWKVPTGHLDRRAGHERRMTQQHVWPAQAI
jgi:hypothetical protein